MTTRSLPTTTTFSPVKMIMNGFSSTFAAIEARQAARAKRFVRAYLARQSDIRLRDMGFTPNQIIDLRR